MTAYGRITTLLEGGYSIELRETPLPPERSDDERAAAIAAVRQFVDMPDLPLAYSGLQRHPENSGIAVEVYDSTGVQFMVDVLTNVVLYMQPSAGPLRAESGNPLSSSQLEEKARLLLATKQPCFEAHLDQLQLDPGNKGDNYFFRWQVPGRNSERPWNQATFIQISLDAYGNMFGYVDSGICYLSADESP